MRFYTPNDGHFAVAAYYEDDWYYFDANIEYKYDYVSPPKLDDIVNGNQEVLKKLYPDYTDLVKLWVRDSENNRIKLTDINNYPAKKGLIFQRISKFISYWGWVFNLLLALIIFKFYHKNIFSN